MMGETSTDDDYDFDEFMANWGYIASGRSELEMMEMLEQEMVPVPAIPIYEVPNVELNKFQDPNAWRETEYYKILSELRELDDPLAETNEDEDLPQLSFNYCNEIFEEILNTISESQPVQKDNTSVNTENYPNTPNRNDNFVNSAKVPAKRCVKETQGRSRRSSRKRASHRENYAHNSKANRKTFSRARSACKRRRLPSLTDIAGITVTPDDLEDGNLSSARPMDKTVYNINKHKKRANKPCCSQNKSNILENGHFINETVKPRPKKKQPVLQTVQTKDGFQLLRDNRQRRKRYSNDLEFSPYKKKYAKHSDDSDINREPIYFKGEYIPSKTNANESVFTFLPKPRNELSGFIKPPRKSVRQNNSNRKTCSSNSISEKLPNNIDIDLPSIENLTRNIPMLSLPDLSDMNEVNSFIETSSTTQVSPNEIEDQNVAENKKNDLGIRPLDEFLMDSPSIKSRKAISVLPKMCVKKNTDDFPDIRSNVTGNSNEDISRQHNGTTAFNALSNFGKWPVMNGLTLIMGFQKDGLPGIESLIIPQTVIKPALTFQSRNDNTVSSEPRSRSDVLKELEEFVQIKPQKPEDENI